MALQTAQPEARTRPWYWLYLALTAALAGLVLLAVGVPAAEHLLAFAVITGLVFVAGLYAQTVSFHSSLSVSLAINVATILIFDPATATWSSSLGIALATLARTGDSHKTVVNCVQTVISVGLAALAFFAIKPGSEPLDLIEHGPAVAAAVLTRVAVTCLLVTAHGALFGSAPLWRGWAGRQTAVSLATFAHMSSLGLIAALVWDSDPLAILFLLGPLVALHLALADQRALATANAQLAHLNETLEQRVSEATLECTTAVVQLRRRLEESATLHATGAALVQELDLERVLSTICREATKVTGAEASFVTLLSADQQHQYIRATYGEALNGYLGLALDLGETLAGLVLRSGQVLVANDAANDSRLNQAAVRSSGARSVAEAPIRVKDAAFGVIGVISMRTHAFDDDDARLLRSLANQAAIAIHNAQLYEKAKEVAVFEERSRIARELHDSVTQSLFSIVLNAEAVRQMITKKPDKAEELTHKLSSIGQEALAEMRSLIFELRPQALQEKGLAFALQNHSTLFEKRHGVRINLKCQPGLKLPPHVEAGFYRIVQEGMTNVAKHARARLVQVTVTADDEAAYLQICDDGVGFDPEEAGEKLTFGLTGMKERLEGLGGTLAITSAPGRGTEIAARVPLAEPGPPTTGPVAQALNQGVRLP